ncbi:hypothetical protein KP591P3_00003 [Klebsiella phage KP591P3]|uniref:hypothetical protein n=1 Tax=Klebsiella phage KP591P1 TaxID=2968665 RepID=UPI00233F7187|nr:hypothetical protein PRB84_gp40 [Klebsiella phage KP591P1]YP_010685419.1 hypothetical protein PRB85_gp03 [Klebsiella phage KP591P3]WAX16321.1 hypothetical protein KP591P1_00040 [Klebsiella phage KP591P1]WAX16362.1 hypothetical protein KP591P3_00003 [Klebsiella phage KP591P3]
MKLIDILVEELPKRGGWPEGVVAITQDSDKATNNYKTADGLETNEHGTWRYSSAWEGYSFPASDSLRLASDYDTAIITREQYEAALAAKNDGWIEWGGGECPVPRGTLVDVRYRDGEELFSLPADDLAPSSRDASFAFWRDSAQDNDIIAYRLHKPLETEQAEADDEADLNECIGQDAAPVWNGEGLPPVGCECEFISNDTSWGSVVVIGVDGDKVVIKPSGETYYGITPSEKQVFRPIRSEADRKRDESLRVIYEILDAGTSTKQDAADIYDAIAAGKIPGVKLED